MTVIINSKPKHDSRCQEMHEVREPMAKDCVKDALRLANLYEHVGEDFWICFASKPHQVREKALVHGWEVVWKKPSRPVPGMLVWHVDSKKKEMTLDPRLSLPYDIPLFEDELSTDKKDIVESVAKTGEQSGVILLA